MKQLAQAVIAVCTVFTAAIASAQVSKLDTELLYRSGDKSTFVQTQIIYDAHSKKHFGLASDQKVQAYAQDLINRHQHMLEVMRGTSVPKKLRVQITSAGSKAEPFPPNAVVMDLTKARKCPDVNYICVDNADGTVTCTYFCCGG